MKIIISERQQELLTEKFSEENLRKFLYSFWNTQKREGETPHLSEDIYDVKEKVYSRDLFNKD